MKSLDAEGGWRKGTGRPVSAVNNEEKDAPPRERQRPRDKANLLDDLFSFSSLDTTSKHERVQAAHKPAGALPTTPRTEVEVIDLVDDDKTVETVNLLDDDEPDSKRSKTTPEDVSHVHDDGERRNWVVMAMVTEDDAARDTYGRCRGAVRREVHDHCFVRDGARHFTLFKLNGLTRAEANRVGLAHAPTALPLDGLELTKFYDWDSCVCVGIGTEDAERLCSAVPPLRGLPARPGPDDGKFGNKTRVEGTAAITLVSRRNLHVSVYRNFGIRGASTREQWRLARAAGGAGGALGSVGVYAVAIKEMGAEYDTCRVLTTVGGG
mgnify:FL=1